MIAAPGRERFRPLAGSEAIPSHGEEAVLSSNFWRWAAGLTMALMMVVVPTVHYRQTYRYGKRLRPVTEGKVYRSGCLTADGLRDAIRRFKIKTVINLQDEDPEPQLNNHYFTLQTTAESEVCRREGARMVFLFVELVNQHLEPGKQPPTIPAFLRIMDDPENYPVLIHCRAGLHRTGCLVALYRQEYEGWSKADALRELKNHGFGEFFSTSANPYIVQYILDYEPRATRGLSPHAPSDLHIHGPSFNPLPAHAPAKTLPASATPSDAHKTP